MDISATDCSVLFLYHTMQTGTYSVWHSCAAVASLYLLCTTTLYHHCDRENFYLITFSGAVRHSLSFSLLTTWAFRLMSREGGRERSVEEGGEGGM